jgi:hypothetical protein
LVKLGYTAAYRARTRRRARSCPPARAAHRTAASMSGLSRAFPGPPLPKAGSTPRCLEVSPRHVRCRPSPVGRTTMNLRSVPCPCACTPTKTKPCAGRSSSALRLSFHRLFKAAKPPHACAHAGQHRKPPPHRHGCPRRAPPSMPPDGQLCTHLPPRPSTTASRAMGCSVEPASSPGAPFPRRPPLGAAVHRCRPLINPQLRSKSAPSEP